MIDEKKLIEDLNKYARENFHLTDEFEWVLEGMLKALDIVERQPKVFEWITVEKRLPEIGTCVLVTTESGCVSDDIFVYDYEFSHSKEPCFHRWDEDMWNCYIPRVIAWMPLPEPYREKVE